MHTDEIKYSLMVERCSDGIVIIQDGLLKFGNSKMTEITGHTQEERLEKPFINCVSPAFKKLVETRYKDRLSGKEVPEKYELEIISKDGRTIPVEINASVIDYEGRPADMAIIRDITDRKQIENVMKEAIMKADHEKSKSEAIVSALGDGIIIQDLDYRITYQNQIQNEIYGEHLGEYCYKVYEGRDTVCEDCPVELTFKDGKIHKSERIVPTENGIKYFELTSSPLRDTSGKIIAGVKIVREITHLKTAEKALRENKRFLESIFGSIQDGIGIIDEEMNIVSVNHTAEKWYSHAMPLVGKKCYEAYHGRKERCEVCPAFQTIKTGKSAYEIVPRHGPDGNTIGWIEIYSYPMIEKNNGEKIRVIEYVRDISERKTKEETLKLFSEAIETAPDGVQIVNFKGEIIYSNKSVERIYGYSPNELNGKYVGDLNADPDIAGKVVLPSIMETGGWTGELMVKHKDGKVFPIWLTTSVVKNGRSEPLAMIGIIKDITERKEAEKKLETARTFLQSVINGVSEPLMVIDKNYGVKLINRAAGGESFIGAQGSLHCYQISYHRNEPCDEAEHPCPLEQVRRTGRPVTVEHEHFIGHGKKHYEILASPLYDADGVFSGIVESSRDVTERKRAEETLKESEKRYRTLFESAGDAIFILDTDAEYSGNIVAANQAAAEMHGYTENELLKMNIKDLDSPESSKEAPKLIRRILKGERIKKELTHRKKDGIVFPVEINAGLLELGGHKYMLAFDRDITERKQAEEALRESTEKFRSIVEQSGDGIVLTDENGIVIEWNRAEEKIIGIEHDEAIGRPIWDIQFQVAIPEKKTRRAHEQLKANLLDMLKTGKSNLLNHLSENDIQRPDGTRCSIQVQIFFIQTEKGFKAGSITRDITERRQSEEAIRNYARELEELNKMKELFIDIMHHDLLNPLNNVSGFIEILREDETESMKRKYLETIERNLAKGVELIESATLLSRLESLDSIEFEDIDLKESIERSIENIRPEANKAGIEIENHITQNMPAKANKIIEEVVTNLLSNAFKYAAAGKKIVIEGKENNDFWRVDVIDFGSGVKDVEKTLIFERFRRLEKKGVKGSGLGLAIAKRIMELHRGRIWVEDNPEGGAIFVVEIPKRS